MKQFLLDTHVFLWWLDDNKKLVESVRATLSDQSSLVHISAVTIWEIAIKAEIGKIQVEIGELVQEIEANSFVELPITARHAQVAGNLPRHHDDPFDRMLIAQAQLEGLVVVTHDAIAAMFQSYGISILPT